MLHLKHSALKQSVSSIFLLIKKMKNTKTFSLNLRYPHLPCLQVGQKKDRYLPMEVCTIIPCQKRHLSEEQTANMIRSTARPAPERQQAIQNWVCLLNPTYSSVNATSFAAASW